jgi:hypothetical protein
MSYGRYGITVSEAARRYALNELDENGAELERPTELVSFDPSVVGSISLLSWPESGLVQV